MASTIKFRINAVGLGSVEIDGVDLSHAVRGFGVVSDAGSIPKITLDLSVSEVEITSLGEPHGTILVNLSDAVVNMLLAFGWQPPADDNRTYRVEFAEFEATDLNTRPCAEDDPLFEIDHASPDAND
jgi:hypothetical protein